MSLGLKRGIVYLESHQAEWEREAAQTIALLKSVMKETTVDIQHVGSTSIKTIPAKPIIDIAVGVRDLEAALLKKEELAAVNVIYRFAESPEQHLFVMGDFENDTRTHHIHFVKYGSEQWRNYLNFRDYLNADMNAAKRYASEKAALAKQFPNDRIAYTDGKAEIIKTLLSEAQAFL